MPLFSQTGDMPVDVHKTPMVAVANHVFYGSDIAMRLLKGIALLPSLQNLHRHPILLRLRAPRGAWNCPSLQKLFSSIRQNPNDDRKMKEDAGTSPKIPPAAQFKVFQAQLPELKPRLETTFPASLSGHNGAHSSVNGSAIPRRPVSQLSTSISGSNDLAHRHCPNKNNADNRRFPPAPCSSRPRK